ncbi:hypothetical protein HID58_042069, partial [Brassica napus]
SVLVDVESPFKPDVLKGKVALITGGGSGIGFEISSQFGKHGASVAIMGRRKQVLDAAVSDLRSLGIQVTFQRGFSFFDLGLNRSVEGGFVLPGDGAATYKVGFRIVVFRPFVGEVIAASCPPVPTERGDDANPFAPMVVTRSSHSLKLSYLGLLMMMVWALFLGGKVLLLMRIMKMMMIPEPNFNLQITMRVSLANQVYQEDQHQVPSIFSQALRIKRLKSVSFLRS